MSPGGAFGGWEHGVHEGDLTRGLQAFRQAMNAMTQISHGLMF